MDTTTNPAIRDKVRQLIVDQLTFGRGTVADDISFLEQGIIDSTGVLELVGHLETTFAITVADDELTPANLDSINNISAYVSAKLAVHSP